MEIKEFVEIEEDGDYIHVSGQFVIETKKGKEINDIVGIAEDDSDDKNIVHVIM